MPTHARYSVLIHLRVPCSPSVLAHYTNSVLTHSRYSVLILATPCQEMADEIEDKVALLMGKKPQLRGRGDYRVGDQDDEVPTPLPPYHLRGTLPTFLLLYPHTLTTTP